MNQPDEITDTQRLEWLEKQKTEHVGGWGGYDGPGAPSFWRNPSVSWSIQQSQEHGQYSMPKELKKLTLRQAIDAAIRRAGRGEKQ